MEVGVEEANEGVVVESLREAEAEEWELVRVVRRLQLLQRYAGHIPGLL